MKSNKNKKISPESSRIIKRLICNLFLLFSLPLLQIDAQANSEQLDPVDFFVQTLTELPQKLIAPKAEKPSSKKTDSKHKIQEAESISREAEGSIDSEEITPKQKSQKTKNLNPEVVNFAANIDKDTPPNKLSVSTITNTLPKRQLWRAGINVLKEHEDKKNKDELQQIITQVRSFEFELQEQIPELETAIESITPLEPVEILPDVNTPQEPEPAKQKTELSYGQLTNRTLQILKNLSQQSGHIDNPFELAEVLFHSGHLKEAAICYRQALEQNNNAQIETTQDSAWILFQIGNCLRTNDMLNASKAYQQLITEYPDSTWADLAKAQNKLIDWHQKDNPGKLITEHKQSNNTSGD